MINFSFAYLKFAWIGVILFCLKAYFYYKIVSRREVMLNSLAHPLHRSLLLIGYSRLKSLLSILFFGLALVSTFLCFLRPQWGEQTLNFSQSGRTVLFALDISRSMLATDTSPSRLELAKLKIRQLLKHLGPERVGLLVFAETAILQCPFTKDFKTFLALLDQVDSSIVSSNAQTSLVHTFEKSLEIFDRSGSDSKILVVCTDGEDFSKDMQPVLNRAKDEHVAFFALGIGSAKGAPVPIIDAEGKHIGHEKDAAGQIVLTKLNEEGLQRIVSFLGGEYKRAVYSEDDLLAIARFIDRFEKEFFSDIKFTFKHETYPFLALIAGCLWLLQAVLS